MQGGKDMVRGSIRMGKGERGHVNKSRIVLASIYPARTGNQPADYLFRAGLAGCSYIFCTVNKFKT